MRIRHRVTFNKNDAVDAEIEALKIKYVLTITAGAVVTPIPGYAAYVSGKEIR
jgi:hypothetical protein